jgi:hydroxymethylbilane synthase
MNQNQKMIKRIRIGTRGSKLALRQANFIKRTIENNFHSILVSLDIIQTQGDKDQASSLTHIGGQGIFTKAIEQALIDGEIDMAVHSLKDLPSQMPDVLNLAAVPKRGPVNDVFIGLENSDFYKLPQGATIASGSIRRRAQILFIRPDIRFADLRGNIETRLSKLRQNRYDGIIMAEAAIIRLKLEYFHYYRFSLAEILPAVSQGAIGIQVRKQQKSLQPILDKINDLNTLLCISSERAFLHRLDSGCQFPVAANAEVQEDKLNLLALVASRDGSTIIKDSLSGAHVEAEQIGIKLAEKLIEQGALQILQGV